MARRSLLWLSLLTVVLLFASAPHVFAQETAAQETAALDVVTKWKIINTLLFAVGLGWLLWKYAPAFFNARSADIQKAIEDATGLKIQADFRYSEIDKRMASLADEVRRMRQQAALELDREHERFRQQAQFEFDHIHRNVTAEIEALQQEGILHLRRRTTQLALQLTERQLRERFQSGEPEELLGDFIHLVEQGKN